MTLGHCTLCLGRGGQIATDALREVEVAPLFNWLEHNPRTQRAQVVHYVVHSLWVYKYFSIFMNILAIFHEKFSPYFHEHIFRISFSWTFFSPYFHEHSHYFFKNIFIIFSWKFSPYFHEHIFRISFSWTFFSPYFHEHSHHYFMNFLTILPWTF